MQVRERVGKSRNTIFFQWFVAPEGRKVGSLKRRVRSHLARWEMKKCTPLWREAHFEVKMYEAHQLRTTFGSCDIEKVHAVVARSTFGSQNVQSTPCSDHFWKLWCRKSACRCGAKAHFEVKSAKNWGYGALLDVQVSFCVAGAGDCAPCQKWVKNVRVLQQFQLQPLHRLHSATLHYITLHYTTPTSTTTSTTATTITLHNTTLH